MSIGGRGFSRPLSLVLTLGDVERGTEKNKPLRQIVVFMFIE